MPNRAVLAGLLLALVLGGCARAVSFPEPRDQAPLFDDSTPPPDTTSRSGGAMGTGT
jgi:hypothetical protein